ncbi:hypothetical protein R2F61_09595 [Mollicutes bacterium LVI A0078]|nr:hypothetical protein RZE84_09350 [Mollicutes bacterium LVI A0075]WOO90948.1 hypothetical protein R2F61_09595 [Mollicutes bacterium LVI A0078]
MILKVKKYAKVSIEIDGQMVDIDKQIEIDYNQLGDILTFGKSTERRTGGYTFSATTRTVAKPEQDGTYIIEWNCGLNDRISELSTPIFILFFASSIILLVIGLLGAQFIDYNRTLEDVYTVIFATSVGIMVINSIIYTIFVKGYSFFYPERYDEKIENSPIYFTKL